ncbi:Glu/Leu/Phe/Val dehydrogenase [Seongchinamella sediminis]|uniref:Glutamate dehydrogenase n=1 Tax=Seongchinamella sediminis TaxID=2283635 RepID=A0A3L7DWR6_9GAMM|nr:Glu/Leu/Phe/Val dehydrogenase [Seongchinamella sediminis]RLQ20683.1 Glu/Leu/Phe/Val dehydrogenase [Seongchinamella sediminis]
MAEVSYDEFGPFKIIEVYEPGAGLRGTLVVDNVSRGPSIGGVRMAPDVSTTECLRLARAMTFKNAAADLPHGGGKSVLYGDPAMPREQKEDLVRAFACALAEVEQYIFGPDMGTDEECMAWVRSEIGRAVGLPRELGGIPLDEIGATGWGLLHAARAACEFRERELAGARVAIQGFGAVGSHAARFFSEEGAIVVAAADARGAVSCAGGLDVARLLAVKKEGGSVVDYPDGPEVVKGDPQAIIDVPCDIWIPAARPDVINESNVARLQADMVISGANIPMTAGAEKILHQRDVLCIPDFIANAGGVICAAMEYHGASESAAMAIIEEKISYNTQRVLAIVRENNCMPRQAAEEMAQRRVRRAMDLRRWSLF